MLYSYLNLESTKTIGELAGLTVSLYSYLNLESTKTQRLRYYQRVMLYSYLNLESTKTKTPITDEELEVVQLLKS